MRKPSVRQAAEWVVLAAIVLAFGRRALGSSTPKGPEVHGDTGAVASADVSMRSMAIAVADARAYVGVGQWLDVVDVSDPADPVFLGRSQPLGDEVADVAAVGDRAYVAARHSGLHVLDVSDPASPRRLGTLEPVTETFAVEVLQADQVVSLDEAGLHVVDVSDPTNLARLGSLGPGGASWIAVDGRRIFVATTSSSNAALQVVNADNPRALGIVGEASRSFNYSAGVVAASRSAYWLTKDDFRAGTNARMAVVDTTDPFAPRILGSVEVFTGFGLSGAEAEGAAVSEGRVFVVGNDIQPSVPDFRPERIPFLKTIDVTNPTAPVLAGYKHLSFPPQDVALAGSVALVSSSEGGFYSLDVGDAADVKSVGVYLPEPPTPDPETASPTPRPSPTPPATPNATPSTQACTSPEWTALIYLNGDNNLESRMFGLFNALERAADNPCLQIRALWDGRAQGDTALYAVQPDVNPFVLAAYEEGVNRWTKGELNMGDPQTLINFARQGLADLPNPHRFLAIVDHGNGWSPNLPAGPAQFTHAGISFDDTSGPGAFLSTTTLADALGVITENGRQPLDIVFYDACLMSMIENAYPLRSFARYLVASQNQSFSSYPYDDYFDAIHAGTDATDLATTMVDRYHESLTGFPRTMAVLDLAQMEPLARSVDRLATSLGAQLEAYSQDLLTAYKSSQKFDSNVDFKLDNFDHFVDLHYFAQLVRDNIPEPSVVAAAQGVLDAVAGSGEAAVAHERSASGNVYGAFMGLGEAHGVSIYLPLGEDDWLLDYYNNSQLSFAADTAWDEFVERLVAVAQPPVGPDPLPVDPDRRYGPIDPFRPFRQAWLPWLARHLPMDATDIVADREPRLESRNEPRTGGRR